MNTPYPAQPRRGPNRALLLGAGLLLLVGLFLVVTMGIGRLIRGLAADSVSLLTSRPLAGMRVTALDLKPPLVDVTEQSITWQPVIARVTLDQGHELLDGRTLDVRIAVLEIRADDLLSGSFVVLAKAISVTASGAGGGSAPQAANGMTTLEDGQLRLPVHLDLWPPAGITDQIEGIARELLALVRDDRTALPLEFSGVTSFRIRQEEVKAALGVHRREGRTHLAMDKESLQVISWVMEEQLTEPEIELLSANPIKTPRLLRIRNEAQEVARQAHAEQGVIPEDAYRHVLWSYLLTTAYGQEFSKSVTDAHEQGRTDNSAAEQRMDYVNNAVGRKYAAREVGREALVGLLLSDPEVIREADSQPR